MAKSLVIKGSAASYSRNTVIEEKNVLAYILDWELSKDDETTVIMKLLIKTGVKKGMTHKDYVTFDPDSKMSWKYAAFRKALGEPIKDNDEYDLGDAIGKYIVIDLIPSKNDKFQNIAYKPYDENINEKLVDSLPDTELGELTGKPNSQTNQATEGHDTQANAPSEDTTPADDLPF